LPGAHFPGQDTNACQKTQPCLPNDRYFSTILLFFGRIGDPAVFLAGNIVIFSYLPPFFLTHNSIVLDIESKGVCSMTRFQNLACSLALVSLSLIPCGCLEIELTTHVNRDGSLLRTESVSGDSAEVLSYGFISPVDSTWKVTLESPNERSFDRKASKLFINPDDLSSLTHDTAWNTLPVRAQVERRFIWFYTEITYRERYQRWNPFGLIPLSEYVSAADLAQSMKFGPSGRTPTKEDSLAQEKVGQKWTEWMYRDMFEAYYAELIKGVKTLNDPSLTPAAVAAHKEEIYRKCQKWWASTGSMDTIGVVIQSIFKNPRTREAIQSNARGFALHNAKLSLVAKIMGKLKQVNIEMPGVLIDSNAPKVEENRGSWKGVADMSYAADYELWMTSRVVNWWMVLITAVVIIGGISFIFVTPARRSKARG
jgi:hypothetical protein